MRPILFAFALAASFLSSPAGLGLSWLVPSCESFNKIGCGLDPNGHCIQSPAAQATSPNQGEIGCTIDPSGRCLQNPRAQGTGAQGEIGCELDPNGRCGR